MKNENNSKGSNINGDAAARKDNSKDDATSRETLSDLEHGEVVSEGTANQNGAPDHDTSSTVLSPDSEFDANDAGNARGNEV
jgi:hypothetical protein